MKASFRIKLSFTNVYIIIAKKNHLEIMVIGRNLAAHLQSAAVSAKVKNMVSGVKKNVLHGSIDIEARTASGP